MCYVWVLLFGVCLWVGRGDRWAGGIFSFPLTKDWFIFKEKKKRWVSLLWKKVLGRLFVTGGGWVECLPDIIYHKIDRMFITDASYLLPTLPPPPKNKSQDFS